MQNDTVEAIKHCDFCGLVIPRKQYENGKYESLAKYNKRHFCTRRCINTMHNELESKAIKTLYGRYERNARKRKLEFELSISEFAEMVKQDCIFCGEKPSNHIYINMKGAKMGYPYNGIDRGDNSQGYHLPNCLPCCSVCNYAKGTMHASDYIELCERVVNQTQKRKQRNMLAVAVKALRDSLVTTPAAPAE